MGKELVFKALKHETLDAIPWVPFAGVHAGTLKNYPADEMLKNADCIVECLEEVNRLYMPDGIPVLFDLQIEAEVLGCDLLWAKNNPPSVTSHPLENEATIPCECRIPGPEDGRVPMALEATRRIKESIGEDTAIYGLICGPFTLASHLRGTNLFMDMMKNKDYAVALIQYCGQVACKMAEMYIDAGADVIAVVDPMISQVSPKMIEKLMSETFKGVFDFIRSKGALSSFFVCGNASKQIRVMCEMGPDGVSVDENVNLVEAKETCDEFNIAIGGNIPLTTTMLYGSQQDNMKAVVDEIDSIDASKNFILSPGCDMPYNTPIENTIACAQAAKNLEKTREMVAGYESGGFDDIEIEIPDYANEEKVIVELFLLDPDQCAACKYMQASVLDNYDAIEDKAEYRIYKYFIKEDIARTAKMGISNLPTMCIDGEPKFISLIPNREELIAAVEEAAAKK
ncbi:MAG: uroporphyrinogen decarboxylase family protein [Bacillota bacterium]|nr:uroporphyrinogen decarboxylase family protein [Bacillota bacterium]